LLKNKPTFVEKKPTKKSSYTILQINDIHVDFIYQEDAVVECKSIENCCRGNSTQISNSLLRDKSEDRKSGYWATPGSMCDIPPRTFEKFVDFVKDEVKPDYIFWLGDNDDHEVSINNQTRHETFTRYISGVLQDQWANFTMFPVLGNHEMNPIESFDFSNANKERYPLDKVSAEWKSFLNPEAWESFAKNGYYSTLLDKSKKVRIIGIFVGAYDEMNWFLYLQTYDPGHMFAWLEIELDKAEKNNEDVFILKHIPIAAYTNQGANKHMISLLNRYANNIRGVMAGHTHQDHITLIKDQQNNYITTQFIGPSLTTFENGHPSFRVYEIDSETNVVVNYKQYRLDSDKWNEFRDPGTKVEWDVAYNFLEEYNMKDLSVAQWEDWHNRIVTDKDVLSKYLFNYQGGAEWGYGSTYSHCDIEQADYDAWVACKGGQDALEFRDWFFYYLHTYLGKWIVKKPNTSS